MGEAACARDPTAQRITSGVHVQMGLMEWPAMERSLKREKNLPKAFNYKIKKILKCRIIFIYN
jgi:hypothetical protein